MVQASPRQAAARGRGVAPVAEAGEAGHVAPDGAAAGRVGSPASPAAAAERRRPAPGPAHRPGALEPLVGWAHGELGLGRAVELPDAPGRTRAMVARLTDSRAGRAGVDEEAQRVEAFVAAELAGHCRMRCRWVGDQEGGGRAVPAQRVERGGRRRSGSGWPASRPRATCRSRSGWRRCGTSASRPGAGRPGRSATPRPRPRRRLGRSPRPTGPSSRPWAGPWCPRCSAWGGSAGTGQARPRPAPSDRAASAARSKMRRAGRRRRRAGRARPRSGWR